MEFREIADRVWVHRAAWFDVSLVVVGGSDGVAVIDTHASLGTGRALREAVRALGAGPVRAIVATHDHLDHTLGTAAFREADPELPVHAHEGAIAPLARAAAQTPQERAGVVLGAASEEAERLADVLATEVVVPDRPFSSARVIDLGDRLIELVHPGRGHTAGDLVVRVPDADVLVAGDLVEESGAPMYGPDSHPLDWPLTLDVVLQLSTPATVIVPGHGASVDRSFVEEQRNLVGIVAETVRDLATRGVPLDQALDAAEWPFPAAGLEHAVARGYADLPLAQRRLPLL